MKRLVALISLLYILTACNSASFDTEGQLSASSNEATGFEVVDNTAMDNTIADNSNDNEDNNSAPCLENCNNTEDDSDADSPEEICTSNCSSDKKNKESCHHGRCHDGHCTVTADDVFEDEHITQKHSCDRGQNEKKVNICQWPAGDQEKEHTLCVSRESLTTAVQKRRQDRYFVGTCPTDLAEENSP